MQRMDISQVAPDLYKALLGVETYLRGSVEPATYELVKLRASITNGCLFCVDMHTNDAMKAGETTQRLFGVAAWREAPWYTDAERAALALTDRSEEHTSELQSLMRLSYAVFCLKKKKQKNQTTRLHNEDIVGERQ